MSTGELLRRAQDAFDARSWEAAYVAWSAADEGEPLDPDGLERLANAAYLTGRTQECHDLLVRANQGFIAQGETCRAAGCAFWLAFSLVNHGQHPQAAGWVARTLAMLDDSGIDCAERGFLVMLGGVQQMMSGDFPQALQTIAQAREIAERFGDPNLLGLTDLGRGQSLVLSGQVAAGMELLDRVMVAATAGDLSPAVTGLVYCAVISVCQEVFDLRRAQQWTVALAHWCDEQPDLVPYSGHCLVHRAEIMQLRGEWPDAVDAAERANDRFALAGDHHSAGFAYYVRADMHRLHGDFASAEEGYREASRRGHDPQPGLALLRLAQGGSDAAAAAIRRVMAEAHNPVLRIRVLAAHAEIMLAVGDAAAARSTADELTRVAKELGAPMLEAAAAQAAGAIHLAEGDEASALRELRRAWTSWRQLGAPYEAARTRELIGLACRALEDEDAAQMELDAAKWTYLQLGAAPDLARVERALGMASEAPATALTTREVEVLRLVASGRTNRAIASDLFLSEKTVARHLSNIFTKLGLPSRAAATAYAYEHHLV